MSRRLRFISVALAVTLVAALTVAPVLAATSSTLSGNVFGGDCTLGSGWLIEFASYEVDAGTYESQSLANPRAGTAYNPGVGFNAIPFGPVFGSFGLVLVPASTLPGDTLVYTYIIGTNAGLTNVLDKETIAFNCSTGAIVPWPPKSGPCGDDGRINTNCAAPVITYCDGETLKVYKLDAAGEGSLLFTYKLADVPTSGSSDKLLKQVGQVKLYWRHEDGLLKLLAPQSDGKIYYMLLDQAECTSEREGAEWGLK